MMEQEAGELLSMYQRELAGYYMEQKQIVDDQKQYREQLRAKYKEEADLRRYKHRMALRQQNKSGAEVLQSLAGYANKFLLMSTEDTALFAYQRRLWTELQWDVIRGLPVGIGVSYALMRAVRTMKKTSGMDALVYFTIPLCYWLYCKKGFYQSRLFEVGYPAHPLIIEQRRKVVNQCCFCAPSMIKNEIEFMHSKLEGIEQQDEEALLREGKYTYSKEFTTGKLGLSLMKSKGAAAGGERAGARFRVVVNQGSLFLECIDPFEELFEVNKSFVEGVDLMDVLDPYIFDNHRDIINALFEVYYDVGNMFILHKGEERHRLQIKNLARLSDNRTSAQGQTAREQMAAQEMADAKEMLTEALGRRKM